MRIITISSQRDGKSMYITITSAGTGLGTWYKEHIPICEYHLNIYIYIYTYEYNVRTSGIKSPQILFNSLSLTHPIQ